MKRTACGRRKRHCVATQCVLHIAVSKTLCTWDPNKAATNKGKHRVSFEEAATVFDDAHASYRGDSAKGEERLIAIGMSAWTRVLVVVCIERREGNVMHIISARRASAYEKRAYEEGE